MTDNDPPTTPTGIFIFNAFAFLGQGLGYGLAAILFVLVLEWSGVNFSLAVSFNQ